MTLMLAASPAYTTIINIPADYPTIQQGIDASTDGDTVLVQPGAYVENINFNGHDIVVASLFLTTQDTAYISSTIIDAGDVYKAVSFVNGESEAATITGFTIINGNASYQDGGGIYCDSSSPTIVNNNIRENIAGYGGGICCINNSNPMISYNSITLNAASAYQAGSGAGIYCDNSNPTITYNNISGNEADFLAGAGGGIYLINCNSSPIISYNLIAENFADGAGAGICVVASNPIIENNTIEGNGYGQGAGISCWGSQAQITGNLIIHNSAYTGGGIFFHLSSDIVTDNTIVDNDAAIEGDGITCEENSNPIITNTIIWQNEGTEIYIDSGEPQITYSDVQGGWEGEGNIDCDPQFCDPENGDYHLHFNSCCVGAGQDGADIGAFGIGCGLPCGDYVIGDFNGSGVFNVADVVDAYSKLKTGQPDAALVCECPPESGNNWEAAMDVNNSCAFNVADIVDGYSNLKTGSPELIPCELCPPEG